MLGPEHFRHPARGLADQGLVLLPALHVLLQQGQFSRCRRAAHGTCQLNQIADGQIETLACHRVQGVGGIAYHHTEGHRLGTGMGEYQRVTLTFADAGNPGRLCRALLLQLLQQSTGLHFHPGIHRITGAGPDQAKTAVRQRQQRQRPIVEKALVGNTLVVTGQ